MEIKGENEGCAGQEIEPQGSSEGATNAPAPASHPAPPHEESAPQGVPEVGLGLPLPI